MSVVSNLRRERRPAVVLLSGGLDSATTLPSPSGRDSVAMPSASTMGNATGPSSTRRHASRIRSARW